MNRSVTRIIPAARTLLIDADGRVLLIRRSDNGMWALPAGGMEPGESVTECMIREVWEETGLSVKSYQPFAVYSEPRFRSPSRPDAQLLTVPFRGDGWIGNLQTRTDETCDARFFVLDEVRKLADLMPMYLECIEDCVQFTGILVVK